MGYKNLTELLVAATALPAAIEAKLPAGAPRLSVTLADAAGKLPVAPDFPVELPDLPTVPAFPETPTPPGGAELKPAVTVVEVKPVKEAAPVEIFGGGYRPLHVMPQAEVVTTAGGGYRTIT